MEDGDVVFGMIYAQGCVCAGTKVLKLNGEPVNIEDVNINDHLLGYNGNNYSNEKISWLSPKAYKECLHIKTSKNNELKCSIDHPILALNKDKFGHSKKTCSFYLANELQIGDTLLIPKVEGHFGNIHEENAFLLGALFGDGSYSDQSCVTLSISSEEEYEYYNNLYNINISKLSQKPLYAQIYFKGIHQLLKKYKMDKQSFNKKQLPYNIFNWDKESLCAFLGGYFNADGNIQIVKNKHRVIKLTCKYCHTLQTVKSLLNKIGINSHIYKEHKKKRILHSNVNNRDYIMQESDIYVLYISTSKDICTFRNNIKFLIKKKQERLDSYIQQLDKNISNNLKFVLRPNGKGKNFIGKEFNNLQEVRIKSIDNIGIQRIYNMTADTTHTYITNGFISSNTAGDKESDFKAAQQIMYSPRAFNMYPINNVYDKVGQGKPEFVYFYPAYLNRNGCYSKDGISDVTKAILEVLINRYNVKYNTSNTSLITKTIAEHPITPQEAIMKTQGNLFPVQQLNERINQIDSNPNEFDDVYVGTLIQLKNGKVEFKPTLDPPIREFPTEDNKEKGAIEIFSLPEIDREGNVYRDRYIMGHDPVDDDQSNTMSLTSTFVFDLFTDKIVAEYTGRQPYADDNFEIVRKLCLFYNAKCLYEAHPYSQKVNTPNGIKLWEDIKVGDTLFSPTKGEVTVIDIPVNKEMPIYKITLEDGRTIDASDNHKWIVYKENSEVTTEITTEQMMKEGLTKQGKYKFFIPEHTGVHYKSKILPIDPYVMGLILTKGLILEKDLYENKIQINLSLDDIKDIKLRIPYDITIRDHKCYFNIKDLNVSLREYFNNNLFSSPFINPLYLYSDTEQRLALLRGLMDGNGNPDIKGPTLFLTEYKELYENILSLARSLGIKCSGKVTKSGKYKILLYPVCRIFKLRNKAQTQYKYSTHSKNKNALIVLKTAIKSIEYSHKEWGKCVTVDSKDGLYLIGDYVVTHNCNKKGIFAYFSKMNCLYLLAETPQYLKDQQIIKEIGYGNKSRGVNATHSINNYADQLTREWLIKPVVIPSKDEEEEVSIPNLMFIKNRAFLQELASYNPNGNYDRIRAFGMVMLYRQEKIILYQGDMNRVVEDNNINNPANDDFFTINYDNRF